MIILREILSPTPGNYFSLRHVKRGWWIGQIRLLFLLIIWTRWRLWRRERYVVPPVGHLLKLVRYVSLSSLSGVKFITKILDLMNKNGTGYLQENFAVKCTRRGCRSPDITKEKLGLRKLVEDLASPETLLASVCPYQWSSNHQLTFNVIGERLLRFHCLIEISQTELNSQLSSRRRRRYRQIVKLSKAICVMYWWRMRDSTCRHFEGRCILVSKKSDAGCTQLHQPA